MDNMRGCARGGRRAYGKSWHFPNFATNLKFLLKKLSLK